MKNSKLTKAQISAKLKEAEFKIEELGNIAFCRKRDMEKAQEILKQEERQTEAALKSLTHIRHAIQTSQAVCYPECSLYLGESNKEEPPEFLLLKYIYNQASNF